MECKGSAVDNTGGVDWVELQRQADKGKSFTPRHHCPYCGCGGYGPFQPYGPYYPHPPYNPYYPPYNPYITWC